MEHLKDADVLFEKARVDLPHKLASHNAPDDPEGGAEPHKFWERLSCIELDPVLLKRHHIVTAQSCEAAKPFDMLRTRSLHHMRRSGLRRLGITSPLSGGGKSTVVANLALSLARHSDLRVLVFDLNLRAPKLSYLFGTEQVGPLQSALRGTRRMFDSTCLKISNNLGVSLSAYSEDHASEILTSQKTALLLDHIERDYRPDLMLFDLAPVSPGDDAPAALQLCDCALLVAEADQSTDLQIDYAERVIAEHSTCLGIVLNKCRFSGGMG